MLWVNDAAVQGKLMFLFGETCSTERLVQCARSAGGGNVVGDRAGVSRGHSSRKKPGGGKDTVWRSEAFVGKGPNIGAREES